jgi:hypothetical protein
MVNRYRWQQLKEDVEEQRIELTDVFKNVFTFFNLMNVKDNKKSDSLLIIPRLNNAEGHAKSVIRLIKNKIEPERNTHLKEETDSYNWLVDNIGRVELQIRNARNDTIKEVEYKRTFGTEKPVSMIRLNEYANVLKEVVNHLGYYPLRNAIDKYKNYIGIDVETNEELEKDINYFWYLVFLEYFHSSEVLGSITAQDGKAPRNMGKVNLRPSRTKFEPIIMPTQGEEIISEEIIGESMFSDPFMEEYSHD